MNNMIHYKTFNKLEHTILCSSYIRKTKDFLLYNDKENLALSCQNIKQGTPSSQVCGKFKNWLYLEYLQGMQLSSSEPKERIHWGKS